MLATPWEAPFSDDGWWFEPKWDGVRALVYVEGDRVEIVGRRGTDYRARYPELTTGEWGRSLVLDGEIVTLVDGSPSFERLQRRIHLTGTEAVQRAMSEVPVACIVFDLLADDGPVIDLPLEERVGRLDGVELPAPFVRSEVTVGAGDDLWDAIVERDLEGMVAKRIGSRYRPGLRSPDWRKIANVHTTEAVVGGFTHGEGGRSATFASLLLGRWAGDRLRYVGSVGAGFSDEDLRSIRAALDEMTRTESPFHADEALPDAVWVEPVLVASIGFRDVTAAGRLRHPRFRGFTADDPSSIV